MNYQNFCLAFLAFCLPVFMEAQQMHPTTGDAVNKRHERSDLEMLKVNKGQLDDFNMQIMRLTSALEDRDAKTVDVMKNLLFDAMKREIQEAQQSLQANETKMNRATKQQEILRTLETAIFSTDDKLVQNSFVNATLFEDFAKLMTDDLMETERAIMAEKY